MSTVNTHLYNCTYTVTCVLTIFTHDDNACTPYIIIHTLIDNHMYTHSCILTDNMLSHLHPHTQTTYIFTLTFINCHRHIHTHIHIYRSTFTLSHSLTLTHSQPCTFTCPCSHTHTHIRTSMFTLPHSAEQGRKSCVQGSTMSPSRSRQMLKISPAQVMHPSMWVIP